MSAPAIPVERRHRDAAAKAIWIERSRSGWSAIADQVQRGLQDDHVLVQAFARFERDHAPTLPAGYALVPIEPTEAGDAMSPACAAAFAKLSERCAEMEAALQDIIETALSRESSGIVGGATLWQEGLHAVIRKARAAMIAASPSPSDGGER